MKIEAEQIHEVADHGWFQIADIRITENAEAIITANRVDPAVHGGEGAEERLPCDVHLPLNTYIRKGCSVRTLMVAIGRRKDWPDEDTRFPETKRSDALRRSGEGAGVSEADDLVANLLDRDAKWQADCDVWMQKLKEADPGSDHSENEAAIRRTLYGQAAARIRDLTAALTATQSAPALGGWREALEQIKRIVCGDKFPNWSNDASIMGCRLRIADIADVALSASPAPEPVADARLFDADAPMECDYDKITAAENVLAWLLIEKLGCVDDRTYSPKEAQEILARFIDRAKEAEEAALSQLAARTRLALADHIAAALAQPQEKTESPATSGKA